MKCASLISLFLALLGCEQKSRTAFVKPEANEIWWTYIADYDGKPGSIIVDLAVKQRAPIQELPTALVTGVSYESGAQDSGLPVGKELDFLNQLAEKRKDIVTKHTRKALLVGTFTSDNKRYDYFYVADPSGLQEALHALYQRECPERKPYVNVQPDAKWDRYLTFLYPNQQTIRFYRSELEKLGVL